MTKARHSKFRSATSALSLLPLCLAVHGQILSFPAGTSPAVQATAAQSVGANGQPSQVVDGAGHPFALSYDNTGRVIGLKRTSGRNIADMGVGYDANNRIQRVRFDNGYEVIFHYRSDGTQEIRDSLGGRVVRAGSPWAVQSVTDPSGYLVQTLQRVELLFGLIQPVPGLNPVTASNSTP